MAFATLDDVRIYAPDVEAEDQGKVEYLLEQAEDLIGIEFPDLPARVTAGEIPLIRIVRVEAEMVASVMNNPYARQSESETLGGLSRSQTFNVKIASGLLRLTDDQRRLLNGVGVAGSGAGVIAPRIGWLPGEALPYPDLSLPPPWPDGRH